MNLRDREVFHVIAGEPPRRMRNREPAPLAALVFEMSPQADPASIPELGQLAQERYLDPLVQKGFEPVVSALSGEAMALIRRDVESKNLRAAARAILQFGAGCCTDAWLDDDTSFWITCRPIADPDLGQALLFRWDPLNGGAAGA